METTGQPRDREPRGRQRRVVLRAGSQRQQLEVSQASESPEFVTEPKSLDTKPLYDHSVWESIPNRGSSGDVLDYSGGADQILNGISSDVFSEKLELSGRVVHSTPHRVLHVTPISHPMHPQSVSSAIFRDKELLADSSDYESDDVFSDRPKTVPTAQVYPQHSKSSPKTGFLSASLPPLPSRTRPHTSPGSRSSSNSTFLTSPVDSKRPPKGRLTRKNRVHPDGTLNNSKGRLPNRPPPNSNPTSPTPSTALKSTSSSNESHTRLSSANSLNSTFFGPLLTTDLRKGGRRPSANTSWLFDGQRQLESCFPDGHANVFVTTWNMHEEKDLPPCLDDLLLPTSHEQAADVYVIGTQESTSSRHEWEVLLQQTLGPSFVLVHSASLGVIYLLLFLRRDLIWYCSAVRSAGYATRPGTLIKTKGGVGLCFTLFGSSFLFITSHFTAHDHKVTERNSDMQRIAANLALSDESSDKEAGVNAFDYVFWFGDFNYRVEMERTKVDDHLSDSDCMSLLLHDQLTKEILQGNVFEGFSEQPITFPPTYKFDLHSDTYDSSERKRTPSWTPHTQATWGKKVCFSHVAAIDRILFRSNSGTITGCGYDSCAALRCSDHRPVFAVFRVKLEPSNELDGIPSTVVTFDRDIYMKAHQQRKHVAQLSASLGAEDEPDGPLNSSRARNPSRNVTSSVCTLL